MKYYLNGKQTQAVDKYTQDVLGVPGLTLMEKAAEKVKEHIIRYADELQPGASKTGDRSGTYDIDKKVKILSVVEGGNNGGDGVAAAWMLKEEGLDVEILEINGIKRKTPSYISEVEKAVAHNISFADRDTFLSDDIDKDVQSFMKYDIIIDAIFGVGLTRDVTGVQAEIIKRISRARTEKDSLRIISVDIPSGISSDTGHILGTAIEADATVTFEYIKYGMLINEGRVFSGKIFCEPIGLHKLGSPEEFVSFFGAYEDGEPAPVGKTDESGRIIAGQDSGKRFLYYEYDEKDAAELIPTRQADSNKGSYGKVLIIAGSKEIYGALYLAAEAAYRVGAGLVKIVTDIRNRDLVMSMLPEAMLLTYDSDELMGLPEGEEVKSGTDNRSISDSREGDNSFTENYKTAIGWADVILSGPGMGTGRVSSMLLGWLYEYITDGKKLILDADALNLISASGSDKWLMGLTDKLGRNNVVITPHVMEMYRLLQGLSDKSALMTDADTGITYNPPDRISINMIKEYRAEFAGYISEKCGVITVLKDARTVVTFAPIIKEKYNHKALTPVYINTTGNSGMSKGGSGDVLAGIMAGLIAESRDKDIKDIAALAVNIHGRAGDKAAEKLGEYSILARDIIQGAAEVINGGLADKMI